MLFTFLLNSDLSYDFDSDFCSEFESEFFCNLFSDLFSDFSKALDCDAEESFEGIESTSDLLDKDFGAKEDFASFISIGLNFPNPILPTIYLIPTYPLLSELVIPN